MSKKELFEMIGKRNRDYCNERDMAIEESKKYDELSDDWLWWNYVVVESHGAYRALCELSAYLIHMDFGNESNANGRHDFHEIDNDEIDEEDKCEACGGEIITRGNCGACLECDAEWGEPEYVECDECGGEAIIDALGFICLDCKRQC